MCQSLGNKPADWPSPILGRSRKKMVDRAFVREATGTARPGQTVRYGMDPASATEGRWKVQTKKHTANQQRCRVSMAVSANPGLAH